MSLLSVCTHTRDALSDAQHKYLTQSTPLAVAFDAERPERVRFSNCWISGRSVRRRTVLGLEDTEQVYVSRFSEATSETDLERFFTARGIVCLVIAASASSSAQV